MERAAALLRAVAAMPVGEATVRALALACGLNRATAWRILATLEDAGLLDRRNDAYVIGFGLARLAGEAGAGEIVQRAHPELTRLAAVSGETTALALVRRRDLYYVDQVASTWAPAENWLGKTVPLHATSAGKSFLAASDASVVNAALARPLEAYTRTTITSPEALVSELAETRARGYATCVGELVPDEYGVAAASRDRHGHVVAVISIWGPSARVPVARLAALGGLAMEAAAAIHSVIGTA